MCHFKNEQKSPDENETEAEKEERERKIRETAEMIEAAEQQGGVTVG